MSWAVGTNTEGRWVGYGVPAICDLPGCGAEIDRGTAYACGGSHAGWIDKGCGNYLCPDHLVLGPEDDDPFLCPACIAGAEPYPGTPDTDEWLTHVLTDESWQEWRDGNPAEVQAFRERLESGATS